MKNLSADDTSTLLVNTKVERTERIYNEELKRVNEWLNASKLSLNVGKSNLIIFRKSKTKVTCKPGGHEDHGRACKRKGACQITGGID